MTFPHVPPIRDLTTVLVVITLCYGFVKGLVGAEAFLSVVVMICQYWFRPPTTPPNGTPPTP